VAQITSRPRTTKLTDRWRWAVRVYDIIPIL
jgi:hypothetical protein